MDLEDYTKPELVEWAKDLGVKQPYKLNKPELIKIISLEEKQETMAEKVEEAVKQEEEENQEEDQQKEEDAQEADDQNAEEQEEEQEAEATEEDADEDGETEEITDEAKNETEFKKQLSTQAQGWRMYFRTVGIDPEHFLQRYPNHRHKEYIEELIEHQKSQ